jgi:hypothetical protein
MTKFAAFVMIIALRVIFNPSAHSADMPGNRPFSIPSVTNFQPSAFLKFSANLVKNKIRLQWEVNDNVHTDQFEVEKSRDGINFEVAAIVFGSEQPEMANYEYMEKKKQDYTSYRIKLINKDKKTEYSNIVVIRS